MNFRGRIIIILSCLAVMPGCAPEKVKPTNGKELYEYYCSACHGESGAGQFLRGIPPLVMNKALNPVPLRPDQIRHKIKQTDDAKRKMPVFSNLTNEEATLISRYISTLSK